ncbi:MAG: hypothetical protein LBO73_02725 [Holosporaceae bacterium]|jgi:hypothetical protein|nr:hypothetical protein [Holosporaceae bacterium]
MSEKSPATGRKKSKQDIPKKKKIKAVVSKNKKLPLSPREKIKTAYLKAATVFVAILIVSALSLSLFKRYKTDLKANESGTNLIERIAFGDVKVRINNDHFSHDALKEESCNNELVAYLQKNLKKGDTVISVTHDTGAYTLLMAKLIQKSGKVYFYNPSQKYVDAVKAGAAINGFENRIAAFTLGISDHGFDGLLVHKNNFPDITGKIEQKDYKIPTGYSAVTVKVSSLDGQLPNLQNINLLKINVHEDCSEIIDGAVNLIKRSEKIAVIINYRKEILSESQVFNKLSALGFKAHRIQADGSAKPTDLEEIKRSEKCFLLFKK